VGEPPDWVVVYMVRVATFGAAFELLVKFCK